MRHQREVVRGADLLVSTPRQLLSVRSAAARHSTLSFCHVPLITAAGEKLSKREPRHTLAGLRALWCEARKPARAVSRKRGRTRSASRLRSSSSEPSRDARGSSPRALGAAVVVYIFVLRWWLAPHPSWSETSSPQTTSDGWSLPLYYYPPLGSPRGAVLCVPGIYANAATFDLDLRAQPRRPSRRARLRDLLRGAALDSARGQRARRFGRFRHAARYHDYLASDLPAAARSRMRAQRGYARVHYVGHSMGGMLFYPLGALSPRIARAVTMGAMGQLGRMQTWMHLIRWPPLAHGTAAFHACLAALLCGREIHPRICSHPWVGLDPVRGAAFRCDRAHRERAADRRYFFSAVANTPTTLIFDFARMIEAGVIRPKINDYEAMTADNHVPTLVICRRRGSDRAGAARARGVQPAGRREEVSALPGRLRPL